MAVLPPLEKRILQTRESDAEMSSSSLSEEDALEYNMSEDLEDSPAVTSPPPSSKPEKANKYKNSKDHKLKNISPFLVQKCIQSPSGNVVSIKLKSRDLLVESSTTKQSEQLLSIKNIGEVPIEVTGHSTLKYTRGVISSEHLMMVSKFVSELQSRRVTAARRITLKRGGNILPTKHVILTFASPVLPKKMTAGFIHCEVRPYVPNPVRCFKCQIRTHENSLPCFYFPLRTLFRTRT
ncbi:hypothetical protein AVEN_262671-1 [Araneus ventricosus]|uniref:Uncharacterized protein n=1 Tax=Araneus ventricosus TaxID=182803 RepID=A0A4Y2WXD7_ARAVE|nr:hypothetical protein AVEN_242942-1 [Araneus ventricosus]GBO41909.1 hypothetical protein AVEN_67918-1 [Araneus ventricosus]GBO41916.1 hypothetical protein AVEN_185275-1 [Araneus ventricosus]GBO41974.1 hypothetical protein AVEN_262671-1 [Araneus ventricosus]